MSNLWDWRADYEKPDDSKTESEKPDRRLSLLCATAYLGYLDLAKELLAEGCCLTRASYMFSSPMQLAAFGGKTDMVMLFQDHLELQRIEKERNKSKNVNYESDDNIVQRVRTTGFGAMTGAALRGDVDMVRLVLSPYYCPDEREYGELRKYISNVVLLATGSLEVVQYIQSRFGTDAESGYRSYRLGHTLLVRHC